jgi:hypothetical protein
MKHRRSGKVGGDTDLRARICQYVERAVGHKQRSLILRACPFCGRPAAAVVERILLCLPSKVLYVCADCYGDCARYWHVYRIIRLPQ